MFTMRFLCPQKLYLLTESYKTYTSLTLSFSRFFIYLMMRRRPSVEFARDGLVLAMEEHMLVLTRHVIMLSIQHVRQITGCGMA
uniref:Uncharacterized protein n=1 Tax=Brassica campestris TaxID=3711 RepID=A0A3P6CDD4_BRACM|nr:unnamed protein product [Brassica rapa]